MQTILLIHGWNNKNYTKFGCRDAWQNRHLFVKEISKYFKVEKINLPGFCGQPEPKKAWDINDFADYIEEYLNSKNIIPDIVLGYSFGAAVALCWKLRHNAQSKIALVSPAITRAYKHKTFLQNLFFLKKFVPKIIIYKIRDLYLKRVGNKFYTEGTQFLKLTYLNIVKLDLSAELKKISAKDVIIIFGSSDTATPPNILIQRLSNSPLNDRIRIISNGDHDIANTHYRDITQIISSFN